MSCVNCEKAQENVEQTGLPYYRWKTANVAIIGCKKHLLEIFNALSEVQLSKRLPKAREISR